MAYVKLPLAFPELQGPSHAFPPIPQEKHSRLALHRETKAQTAKGESEEEGVIGG